MVSIVKDTPVKTSAVDAGTAQTIRDLAPTVRVRTIVATIADDGTISVESQLYRCAGGH